MSCGDASSLKSDARMVLQSKIWSNVNWICRQFLQLGFQIIMLLDALPLLEAPEIIFSRKETYQLMKCLEDAIINQGNKDSLENSDRVNIIRLALVRNLARSFVIETGDSESDDEI
ncbi:nuclear pore complex protein Nup85 [Trichonephila clavata]|uniref:Nucleoporin Nup85 n=1 Tax=Trichonephila clavata TaxID=2740835 RepID=A0A8X6G0M9_TRICU|nr:nuclear pore complex protein Nup85 [Trichonephila clavata]